MNKPYHLDPHCAPKVREWLAAGRKVAGSVTMLPLAEIGIPVLPEFAAPKRWSF